MKSREVKPGQRFGRLTVIAEARCRWRKGKNRGRDYYRKVRMVTCRCDCGTVKDFILDNMVRGDTVSCGCRRREQSAENMRLVHDMHGRIAGLEQENARLQAELDEMCLRAGFAPGGLVSGPRDAGDDSARVLPGLGTAWVQHPLF